MTRIALVAITMVLIAFSLSSSAAPSTGAPDQGYLPEPHCVPHWVVYAGATGWACHEENSYWVAVGTTWRYLRDDECNRPDRAECDEWYHPDTLWDTYDECCAAHGGCTVPVCHYWE